MAEIQIEKSVLRLVLEAGYDPETLEPVMKRKTFNNIKTDASATQLQSVANALASLQQHDLYKIERVDESRVTE